MTLHWHRPDREKSCIMCGQTKNIGEFSSYGYITKQGKKSTRYESRCKACCRERRNARYSDPATKEIDQKTSLKWKHENKQWLSDYQRKKQQSAEYRAIKAAAQRRRKAKLRAGTNANDSEEIKAIYRAALRLEKETGIKHHVDHIIPLKLGGKHEIANLQILTATENMRKGARLPRLAMPGDDDA